MKTKLLNLAFAIMLVFTLTACEKETITTEEITQYIVDNKFNVDTFGNEKIYSVEKEEETNKIIVGLELIEAKEALEQKYGDLIEVVKITKADDIIYTDPTKAEFKKLRKEFGLEEPNFLSKFFDSPLFHGDLGYTGGLGLPIVALIIVSLGIFFVIYMKRKRKPL